MSDEQGEPVHEPGAVTREPEVQMTVAGKVAHLRLNRPAQLNAFSVGLVDALDAALDAVEALDDCRAIIISGNGRAFSAGGDLKEFQQRLQVNDLDGVTEFVDYAARTLTRLEDNCRPVIAAVGGVAVAGGLELILCCDIVIAARDVMMGDGHLRYGVLPGGGGAVRLVRKLSPNVASRLLLTAELVSAEYLREQGLVNEVVDAEELEPRAVELAEQIAGLSPLAISHVKRVAREAASQPVADGLRLELEALTGYIASPDFAEGVSAFDERRRPEFPPIDRRPTSP
jgi:enoyl-CoA hydratase/carnithine racemase